MAIQEWTSSGVVGPIDVMGRSCAGIREGRASRCIGPGVSHGAKSQWRCVLGQWISWAEVAQNDSTTKAELWRSMRTAVLIDCVGVGFFKRGSVGVGHWLLARAHSSQNGNSMRMAVLIDCVGVGAGPAAGLA